MQPHVLIIGCGDLGSEVAKRLVRMDCQVTGVKRSSADIPGITVISADVTAPASLTFLSTMKPDILVYCVAAGEQTDEQYKAQYVDGLNNILHTQKDNANLKHVFFVSSTRVYGQHSDVLIDETVTAIPCDFGGERLLQAEQLLVKSVNGGLDSKLDSKLDSTKPGNLCNFNSTILRLSGIYGPGRLRMIKLAETANWPTQDSWSNRIHRDDAAAFITYLIQNVLKGNVIQDCYIVTDSSPVTQYEVLDWLAGQLHVPKPETGEDGVSSVDKSKIKGKRLSNAAMLASGFKMQYPDYRAGYSELLASIQSSGTDHD